MTYNPAPRRNRTVRIASLLLMGLPLWSAFSQASDDIAQYLPSGAQAIRAALASEATTREIARRSDGLFGAIFTHCEPDLVADTITVDFEFHHDQWGTIADSRERFVGKLRKQCQRRAVGEERASRRELVPDTRAVYPSGETGAIETGIHRFYEIAEDGSETLVGIARYSHLWRREDGRWRVARILSYDHWDVH